MTTSFKRRVVILVAGVALLLAVVVMLPGIAEAQDTDGSPTEAEQNVTDQKGAPSESRQAPGPSKHLVIDPGDSLWSIGQEQIGSGATPQQIAYEVERIFELNRDRIGNDPNLIVPGQELLLPLLVAEPVGSEEPGPSGAAVPEPATTTSGLGVPEEPVVSEPAIAEQVPEPVDAHTPSDTPPDDPEDEEATPSLARIGDPLIEFYNSHRVDRRLLGLGILALTLAIGLLLAWRRLPKRAVDDPMAWKSPGEYCQDHTPGTKAVEEAIEKKSSAPSKPLESAQEPSSSTGTQAADPASARPPACDTLAVSHRQQRLKTISQRALRYRPRPRI